jgi:hypothetical protein
MDPFKYFDERGVGTLVKYAYQQCKAANNDIHFQVCGHQVANAM